MKAVKSLSGDYDLWGSIEEHAPHTSRSTNYGIPRLAPLADLEFLDLVGTQVNDEGLIHLSQLKNLKPVRVDAPISAAGIVSLAR